MVLAALPKLHSRTTAKKVLTSSGSILIGKSYDYDKDIDAYRIGPVCVMLVSCRLHALLLSHWIGLTLCTYRRASLWSRSPLMRSTWSPRSIDRSFTTGAFSASSNTHG